MICEICGEKSHTNEIKKNPLKSVRVDVQDNRS